MNTRKTIFIPVCIFESSGSQQLLGVTIDGKLIFNEHVTNLCDKGSMKIQALGIFFPYLPHKKYHM